MSVLGTLLRDAALEDDGGCLVQLEFGPFDEVREVGLEEREVAGLVTSPWVGAMRGGQFEKVAMKSGEEIEAPRVVRPARGSSSGCIGV